MATTVGFESEESRKEKLCKEREVVTFLKR